MTGSLNPAGRTGLTAASPLASRTAAEHGDTCPNGSVARENVTIGSSPGVLLAWDCGILTNIVAVHDTVGYAFVFRDPTVHAATEAADHNTFVQLLRSVRFSG